MISICAWDRPLSMRAWDRLKPSTIIITNKKATSDLGVA